MGREPWYTLLDETVPWDNNPAWRNMDSSGVSCDNATFFCKSWGETGTGGPKTLQAYLDPNLHDNPGTADVYDDMASTIIPAWNAVSIADAPNFQVCTAITCAEQVYVVLVPPTDPNFIGTNNAAVTVPDGNASSNFMSHRTVKVRNNLVLNHDCGTVDDHCASTPTIKDDRTLISHEWGHVYGLGHCDRYSAVMCNLSPITGPQDPNAAVNGVGDFAGGDLHWIPQSAEISGLARIYP